MTTDPEPKFHGVDLTQLPQNFPTHRHDPAFWEALGRAVATFGFLEEILGKAVLAFTATKKVQQQDVQKEFEKWEQTLKESLTGTLPKLIELFEKSVDEHQNVNRDGLEELIVNLRQTADIRHVLCHGSWRPPDADGRSTPFFVLRRTMEKFETPIDVQYLGQAQRRVAELASMVVNTVTRNGWQFPGSNGPGDPVTQAPPE